MIKLRKLPVVWQIEAEALSALPLCSPHWHSDRIRDLPFFNCLIERLRGKLPSFIFLVVGWPKNKRGYVLDTSPRENFVSMDIFAKDPALRESIIHAVQFDEMWRWCRSYSRVLMQRRTVSVKNIRKEDCAPRANAKRRLSGQGRMRVPYNESFAPDGYGTGRE